MGCGSKMEITVIDDIIDTKYQEGIKGILLGDDAFQGHLFPWYYTEDVTGAGDKDSQHRAALGHEYVYIDHDHDPVGKVISGFHNMFIPMLKKVIERMSLKQEETGILEIVPISKDIFDLDVHFIPKRKGDHTHLHFDVRFTMSVIVTVIPSSIMKESNPKLIQSNKELHLNKVEW